MNISLEQSLELLAYALYDHYCEQVGGKAFNGDPLPKSDEFFSDETKQKQANAWRATAKKAYDLQNPFPKESAKERILDAPIKHNLSEIFRELKFGRPSESQQFLDKAIAVLESGEMLNHVSLKA